MSRKNNFLEKEQSITLAEIHKSLKITDRRTEIARLKQRKLFALVGWLTATWGVFYFVWVFNYETYATPDAGLRAVLLASIFPAIIGAFFYFNERRTVNPKILRLMKYELLFDSFFEAMITDMERNDAEKGNTWRTMDLDELRQLQNRTWGELQTVSNQKSVSAHFELQPKLANYSAMIFLRMEQKINDAVKDKYDRPGRS